MKPEDQSTGIVSTTARKILESFAEAYPLSAHFKGGSKLRLGGWDRRFPEITRGVEAKEEFLAAVEELVSAGVLSVKWQKFREGDRVQSLCLENPDVMFRVVGETHPETERNEMLEVIKTGRSANRGEYSDRDEGFDTGTTECVEAMRSRLGALLESRHPVPVKDAVELGDILKLASLEPDVVSGYSIRALSIRLFGDSKRIEGILKTADKIAEAAWGRKLSEYLGLDRRYPETTCKGRFTLHFFDGREWRFSTGAEENLSSVTLPVDTVDRIASIEWADSSERPQRNRPRRILSVENKETYHVVDIHGLSFDGYVYTSGHPNDADTAFLRACAAAGAEIYHFGDLDPDGILILRELDRALPGGCRPWMMSKAIHSKYIDFGRNLTPSACRRISSLSYAPVGDLIEAIRRTGIGVEQEVIDLGDGTDESDAE